MRAATLFRILPVVLVFLVVAGCASWTTTEKEDILTDVSKLKREMRDLKGPTASGGGVRDELADSSNRLTSVENQLAQLKGVDEDFDHRLSQLEGDLQALRGSAAPPYAAGTPGAPGTPGPGETPPGGDEPVEAPPAPATLSQFDAAMQAYKAGRYREADNFFAQFIKENPRSAKLEDAYFYRGESQFGQGNYEDAIVTYDEFRKRFRGSRRIPAALLKQGMAFKALGFKSDARPFFRELIRLYPNAPEAAQARREMESL